MEKFENGKVINIDNNESLNIKKKYEELLLENDKLKKCLNIFIENGSISDLCKIIIEDEELAYKEANETLNNINESLLLKLNKQKESLINRFINIIFKGYNIKTNMVNVTYLLKELELIRNEKEGI